MIKNTKTICNPTITNLDELGMWQNPRLFEMKNSNEVIGRWKNGKPRYKRIQRYPSATKGETLMKACKTMQEKYGVEFVFCHNSEQGAKSFRTTWCGGIEIGKTGKGRLRLLYFGLQHE